MQNIFIDILPPWVETGLQPAFYDLESGTVLQQTARMYAKVRELTEGFNTFTTNVANEINRFETETNNEIERFENATDAEIERFENSTNDEIKRFEGVINSTVEEYIEKFNQLHDYVEDYFDNLDVQAEINNKLDAMVEAGTLQEIITTYIQSNVAWTFDSVADMKASTNLVDGSYARTLGYYSVNDGGGATYYINTTGTADEGTIIAIGDTLKAHIVIDKNTINVKQMGAKGDGTTDDTAKITLAINNASNVYLPTGSYKLSTKIDLTGKSVTIYGDGAKLGRANYSPKTVIISPDSDYAFKTTYPSNCYFKRLSFNGDGIDEMTGTCEECDFISSNRGIYYVRGRVTTCYFKCDNYGIYKAVDSTISNCIFDECGAAISLHGADNRIINNRIDWNNLGIELVSSSYNTIEGNIFDRQTTYGITIDNACHHNNITGNLFERNLINHIKGALYDVTINSNKFVKKIIIDGDESSDQLPTTAFDFSDFYNSSLVGNEIYADKVNKTVIQLSNTSSAVGNIVNNKNTDFIYTKLGDLTVGANSIGTLDVQWSAIKANILNFTNGANFSLANIEVRDGDTRNYIGSDIITDVNYNPYWNIQVGVNNNTSSSKTYNIYAKFEQINIFKLDFSTT